MQYPSLLKQVDNKGDLPLFSACELNDVTFFKWLLKEARSRRNLSADTPTVVFSPDFNLPPRGLLGESDLDFGPRRLTLSQVYPTDDDFVAELDVPQSPSTATLLSMQPFAAGENGRSVLHILAEKGSSRILTIITQVCHQVEGLDFSVLTARHGSSPLPIEKALLANDVACVNILTDLAIRSYQLHILLEDKNILKNAVATKNLDCVKALIKFGFHSGIELAITMAATYRLHNMVRLLLFWKVEIQSYYEFSHKHDVKKFFTASDLHWKNLELQSINSSWILDALAAMNNAAIVLNEFSKAHSFKENNAVIFQELGNRCIQYLVDDHSHLPPGLSDQGFARIVCVNLSENHLEEVPPELFKLTTLTRLDLKYNKIRSLPSSDDYTSEVYKAKLDTLCIDYNQLQHLPDDMMYGLANSLTTLTAQNNKLEDLPAGLWIMPKLTILKVASNRLSSLHHLSEPHFHKNKEFFQKMSQFEVLSDGSLQPPRNLGDAETEMLIRHFKNLAAFLYTVCYIYLPSLDLRGNGVLFGELIHLYQSKLCYIQGGSFDSSHLATSLSEEVTTVSALTFLDLSYNKFKTLPWDLPCLAPKVVKLDLTCNSIKGFDIIQDLPKDINNLTLKRNRIASLCEVRSGDLPCGMLMGLLTFSKSGAEKSHCVHTEHKILGKLTRLILDDNHLDYVPVLKRPRAPSALPFEYVNIQGNPIFPDLAILSIASNRFITVPRHLHHIKHLSSLNLSDNDIQELPEELGSLNTDYITLIKMDGIKPKNIPEYVLKSSARRLVIYLRELKQRLVT